MTKEQRRARNVDTSVRGRLKRTASWNARKATASRRALPSFMMIGGQRCGTSSLWQALQEHPDVAPANRKEVHYFDLHYDRGVDWYRANFPMNTTSQIVGEATPNYLVHPEVPGRVAAAKFDCKFVVLLRHPTMRAQSAWKLRRFEGNDDRSFEAAVESELSGAAPMLVDGRMRRDQLRLRYLHGSAYVDHLGRWFEQFSKEQFHIVQSEEMFTDPSTHVAEIQRFIGVEPHADVGLHHRNSTESIELEPGLKDRLDAHFAPQIEQLETLVGRSFDW